MVNARSNNKRLWVTGSEEKLGKSTWEPNEEIVKALDEAFYQAFTHVVPTGKTFYLGVDVSGSMSSPALGSRSVRPTLAVVSVGIS